MCTHVCMYEYVHILYKQEERLYFIIVKKESKHKLLKFQYSMLSTHNLITGKNTNIIGAHM